MVPLLLSLLLVLPSYAAPKTFRARLSEDLGSLDWTNGEVNSEIVYQLMDGLFRSGHDGKPELAVARKFAWNKDQTELRLELGESRWSDGKPVCAQHFVDAWNRLRDKAFASPYAHYAAPFESFRAKGCGSLTVRFRRPAPEATALLSNLVFFPVRLDNLKAYPKAYLDGNGLLVNGPFRVAEWRRNTMLALEPNPKHAGTKATLERVEFRFIPEDSTAKAMFELGELDWVKEVPRLLRTPEMDRSGEVRVFPSLIEYYFGLNFKHAPVLEDPGVRHLLSNALDREEIPKILGEECRGITSWLDNGRPPETPVLDSMALARLKAAAAKGPLGLELHTYAKTSHKLLAEWAQGQWEKHLGIRVPVMVEESKVYWKEVGADSLPIFFGGVTAPYAHPRAFLQEFLKGSSANWTSWGSDEYGQAVGKGKFPAAEAILERDGFVIPLYRRDTVALVKRSWQGFWVNPLGQVYLAEVR